MSDSIGIMDPAFFVGRNELLTWVNSFFALDYRKIEEAATGALHCQILDAVMPGGVPLHKVNFNAKFDYEFIKNYAVLHAAFDKHAVRKHVPVERLIKAKYQDNLEMLQWMKWFFDNRYTGQAYDAAGRRAQAMKRYNKQRGQKKVTGPKRASSVTKKQVLATSSASSSNISSSNSSHNISTTSGAVKPHKKKATTTTTVTRSRKPVAAAKTKSRATKTSSSSSADAMAAATHAELCELRLTVEGLEKERNFYFDKLRNIEILCADDDDGAASNDDSEAVKAVKAEVLALLYATDENQEFQAPALVDADDDELEDETVGVVDVAETVQQEEQQHDEQAQQEEPEPQPELMEPEPKREEPRQVDHGGDDNDDDDNDDDDTSAPMHENVDVVADENIIDQPIADVSTSLLSVDVSADESADNVVAVDVDCDDLTTMMSSSSLGSPIC